MPTDRLDACAAAGVEPLLVLAATPAWATTDTSYGNYLGVGSFSPQRDVEDWREYVRRVVTHCRGRVKAYEIWNEPNNNEGVQDRADHRGFFFYGSNADYPALLKAASDAAKQADPSVTILGPSGTGNFLPFLDDLGRRGGLKYLDALSIHTYTTPFAPEIGYQMNDERDAPSRVRRAREIAAKYGRPGIAVWDTEVGFWHAPWTAGRPMTEAEILAEADPTLGPYWTAGWAFRPESEWTAAAHLQQMFLLNAEAGVAHTFYHHGLVEGGRAMPITAAYAAAPPAALSATVAGAATVASADAADLGKLLPADSTPPADAAPAIPGLSLPIADATPGESAQVHGNDELYFAAAGSTARWTVPDGFAGGGAVYPLLAARTGDRLPGDNFGYAVQLDAGPWVPLIPWPAEPRRIVDRGEGYLVVRGTLTTAAPLTLKPGSTLRLRSDAASGFAYALAFTRAE